jgi:acyl-CoA synthetase (AMP-forming)/AMP-acid ligase II
MRNVDLYGQHRAIVTNDEVVNWKLFAERVFRVANRLLEEGLSRGGRVAVLQRNGPEIAEIYQAAAVIGAVVIPISPRLTPGEVQYIVADSEATFAFIEENHPSTPVFAGLKTVHTRSLEYHSFRDQADAIEPRSYERPEDPVLQLYTSGTTGRPKGAVISQAAMIQNGLSIQLSQRLTHDEVFLTATPLTHAASGTRIFSLSIDGMAHVILERYTPELFMDAVESHGVTSTILVPTMLQDLLDSPAFDSARLSSLRTIVYGAAPSTTSMVENALRLLPCGIVHGYGLTEGCPALTILNAEEHRRFQRDPRLRHRLLSIGRPVPGVRFKLVDENGDAVKTGERGELLVRSTKSMLGYWHQPEETKETVRDGWLATGDVGRQDEDGYLYLLDRKKELLISGGFNVYPSEIERVLARDPGVIDVAVVGIPDDRWGEVPVAFVVASTDEVFDGLWEICQRELADYKQPRRIIRVESLPRNGIGKILRRVLRTMAIDTQQT